ncbi:PEP-utilizing enzyme [Aliagarivorans marinus]|uniref:PEP-utilizing enzyme n=1 Tax=Aliagarivorans marinus TaxID=561965 RepID=UPI0003F945E8|nr:PEP-utilizing enzyme [Aliagarivorans marinus]
MLNNLNQSPLAFSTKGGTLLSLRDYGLQSEILNGLLLSYREFKQCNTEQLENCFKQLASQRLIVRSSCSQEDSSQQSNAGKFESISSVEDAKGLSRAIATVFNSYQEHLSDSEVVFIQPQLEHVEHCGVAFSCVPDSGAPYLVVSESSDGETDTVTAGESNHFSTHYLAARASAEPRHQKVWDLLEELKIIFPDTELDIEFAFVAGNDLPFLLQVRPLIVKGRIDTQEFKQALEDIAAKLHTLFKPHPYLSGKQSVLGVMPDWNPAEIIGLRPKPLALSLYKDLVTDSTWAYQRNNYGYKNLRSFPLMIDLRGLPYIDVRTSFNSFIPNDLPTQLANKLVDYYLDKLMANPSFHDKVEFDIVLSCYSLDIERRLSDLREAGFTELECHTLASSLRNLTNRIIDPRSGLWIQDLHRIEKLKQRQATVNDSIEEPEQRVYWLLEDCKRYGTLPFAGLARAGFIAVQLLQSLIHEQVITEQQYHHYLLSLQTVSGQLSKDFQSLDRAEFLVKYGHLRPGTYDICSPRYDAAPDTYFDWDNPPAAEQQHGTFELSNEQYRKLHQLLEQHGINHSVDSFLHFIASAIEGREFAKFVFSKSLSDAIEDVALLGDRLGFSREEMAFADINVIRNFIACADSPKKALAVSIEQGKRKQLLANKIHLPALICGVDDIYRFTLLASEPNFVTQGTVDGEVVSADYQGDLQGKIVCIPSADPGFDWLFAKGIASLITEFGGCNSHMAIRANELGLPAIIGAGQQLYQSWSQTKRLHIDCANKKVTVLA